VVVPAFKLGVVAQHNVLHLLCNIVRVLFKLSEVRDVKQALEWVRLNFFLRSERGFCLRGVRLDLTFLKGRTLWSQGDDSLDHAILLKWTIIGSSILKGEEAAPMLKVLMPVTFILAAIGVVESTLAVSQSVTPVANVSVS